VAAATEAGEAAAAEAAAVGAAAGLMAMEPPGGCGKAAHSPRTEKMAIFSDRFFSWDFFTQSPKRLGFDLTHLVLFFFQ
jgi:hypothetical protein